MGGERSVSHLRKGFWCDPGAVKICGKTSFDFGAGKAHVLALCVCVRVCVFSVCTVAAGALNLDFLDGKQLICHR